ncbi:MAG: HEAT repeat domain-containing protein [Nitrospira sp.]|nr:HEAT repeat domain-containing protein [Nitrospira sp.]
MVTTHGEGHRRLSDKKRAVRHLPPSWLRLFTLLWLTAVVPAAAATPSTIESTAKELYQAGDYAAVTALYQTQPPGTELPKEFLRLSFMSYVRLGRPSDALPIYDRLAGPGHHHDVSLLRPLALAVVTGHVRDRKEAVRVAAYSALAELGLPETEPILEDGLLDSSIAVRARAVEAMGKAGLARRSGAPRRAMGDPAPTVRIAAINALGEAKAEDVIPKLLEIARKEEGPESIFACAALYRMGRTDKLTDISGAATLPDPDLRMAAIGVLGRLKHRSSLAILSRAVYDPLPAVRAFAAGALGEFGSSDGVAPLLHAIGDEIAMVRGIAAASLGKVGGQDNRPVLQALTRDASWQVRAGAVEGLLRLGDVSAIPLATDLARHADPSVRGAAAQALSLTSDKRAIEALETLLQDRQPFPRLMAAKALGNVSTETLSALLKALRDSDETVRIAAAASILRQLDRTPPRGRR